MAAVEHAWPLALTVTPCMVAVHLKAMHDVFEAQLAVYVYGETHAPAVLAGIAEAVAAGLPKPSQH